jgi:hypothetical protein
MNDILFCPKMSKRYSFKSNDIQRYSEISNNIQRYPNGENSQMLRGYQAGCESQRLHRVQGGQAQVRGPDLRQTPTPPTPPQPPPTTTPTPPTPPPRLTGAQQPHPAGRSLHRPPALGAGAGAARGWREGVVKRLLARPKADAD